MSVRRIEVEAAAMLGGLLGRGEKRNAQRHRGTEKREEGKKTSSRSELGTAREAVSEDGPTEEKPHECSMDRSDAEIMTSVI